METVVTLIFRGIARLPLTLTLPLLFFSIICNDFNNVVGCMGLQFNFPAMASSNRPPEIAVMNDSYFSSNALSLTKNSAEAEHQPSVGRVLYKYPIPLWTNASGRLRVASFHTSFHFRIKNSVETNSSGDGMAFLMSGNLLPAPPNSNSNGLGILDRSRNRDPSNFIVAIEFDTYRDSREYGDVDDNHVGIDINSLVSSASRSLDGLGIKLKSGITLMVWVDYDANFSHLSVFVATSQTALTKPGTAYISHAVNLSTCLPQQIYVGFSATTSKYVEIHEIFSWYFSSTQLEGSHWKLSIGAIVGIVLASVFLVLLLPIILRSYRTLREREKNNGMEREREWTLCDAELVECTGPRRLSYKEIITATKNFSEENYLGRGGFGPVYKGILPKEGIPVAVKSVGQNSKQGEKEFIAEVTIISRVRHRNLLQLQGWCHEKGKLFLVYDYMPNGSLDQHLFKERQQENQKNPLNWNERYKIVCGLAAGLLYLHEEWEKQVIHRDVKSANVMLDQDMNAHLGDFGLARLVDHDHIPQTTAAAGTFGYIPPEVVETGKATSASDVYSFGAVALEVACGRHILDYDAPLASEVRLVGWVWDLYSQGLLSHAADPRLETDFDNEEMERVMCLGLACSHPMPNFRPTMRQVCDCLLNKKPPPPISTSKPELVYSDGLFERRPQSISQVICGTSSASASTVALSSSISQSSCQIPR